MSIENTLIGADQGLLRLYENLRFGKRFINWIKNLDT